MRPLPQSRPPPAPPPRGATLDVRPLLARGTEPFPLIRRRVDRLAAGGSLTVIAPFLPAPLIERLRAEGFGIALEHRPDGAWAVQLTRP